MNTPNKVQVLAAAALLAGIFLAGCSARSRHDDFTVPAEEFSRSVKEGTAADFSFHRLKTRHAAGAGSQAAGASGLQPAALQQPAAAAAAAGAGALDGSEERAKDELRAQFGGDPRYTSRGLELKRSVEIPSPRFELPDGGSENLAGRNPAPADEAAARGQYAPQFLGAPPRQSPVALLPKAPPGSSAPYHNGQMTSNPSLWPDEARGAFLFTDHRGYQPMDIITIVINENTKGKKKAETEAEDKFDITAGISEFFGIETKKWAANNTSLDPANLLTANTASKFEGDGETEREGSMNGQISAVILEVLPNNVMRIEGTKIVSVNDEEEVLVLSGLVRPRDINSQNQVDSSRVANMRIDFYGRGVIGENQSPGWGARVFQLIWPF